MHKESQIYVYIYIYGVYYDYIYVDIHISKYHEDVLHILITSLPWPKPSSP